MISTFFATPSQWALQYLSLSGAMQLQAAFAHFFVAWAAIVLLLRLAVLDSNLIMLRCGFGGSRSLR
jgi:hypothetical protein